MLNNLWYTSQASRDRIIVWATVSCLFVLISKINALKTAFDQCLNIYNYCKEVMSWQKLLIMIVWTVFVLISYIYILYTDLWLLIVKHNEWEKNKKRKNAKPKCFIYRVAHIVGFFYIKHIMLTRFSLNECSINTYMLEFSLHRWRIVPSPYSCGSAKKYAHDRLFSML